MEHGIHTRYVCGNYYGKSPFDTQDHAWLITDDNLIIDITGDQFKYSSTFLKYDLPVYYGRMDAFHRLFEVDNRLGIKDNVGTLGISRLERLYRIILNYIEK